MSMNALLVFENNSSLNRQAGKWHQHCTFLSRVKPVFNALKNYDNSFSNQSMDVFNSKYGKADESHLCGKNVVWQRFAREFDH